MQKEKGGKWGKPKEYEGRVWKNNHPLSKNSKKNRKKRMEEKK